MGGGVAPLDARPVRGLDAGLRVLAHLDLAGGDPAPVEDDSPARREALRVLDREAAGRGDDRPAVADLAAALRIERRPVEHDLSVLALLEDGHLRQPADDELDAALPVDHLVAEELRRDLADAGAVHGSA